MALYVKDVKSSLGAYYCLYSIESTQTFSC